MRSAEKESDFRNILKFYILMKYSKDFCNVYISD